MNDQLSTVLSEAQYSMLLSALQAEGYTTVEQLRDVNLWSFMNQRRLYPIKERYEIWRAAQRVLQALSVDSNNVTLLVDGESFIGHTPAHAFSAYISKAARTNPLQIRNVINRSLEGQLILTRNANAFTSSLPISTLSAYIDASLSAEAVVKFTQYISTHFLGITAAISLQQGENESLEIHKATEHVTGKSEPTPVSISIDNSSSTVSSWSMVLIYALVLLNAKKRDCCNTFIDMPFFEDGSLLLSKKENAFGRSHNLTAIGCRLNIALTTEMALFSIAKVAYGAGVPWESIAIQVKDGDHNYEIFQRYVSGLSPETMAALTSSSNENRTFSPLSSEETEPVASSSPSPAEAALVKAQPYCAMGASAKWAKTKLILDAKSDIVYASYARFDYDHAEPAIVVLDGYSTAADSWLKALDAVMGRLAEDNVVQLEKAIKARFYTSYFTHNESGALRLNLSAVSSLKPVKMMSIIYHLIAQTHFHPASFGIKCTALPTTQSNVAAAPAANKPAEQFKAVVGSAAFQASTSREALRLAADALMKHFGTKATSAFIDSGSGRTPVLRMKSGIRHTIRLKSGFYLFDGNDYEQHRKTLQAIGSACRIECDLTPVDVPEHSSPSTVTEMPSASSEAKSDAEPSQFPEQQRSIPQPEAEMRPDTKPEWARGFTAWLIETTQFTKETRANYISWIADASAFALHSGITNVALCRESVPQDILSLIRQIDESMVFQRWDQSNNYRYHSALRKYREYAMYLVQQNKKAATDTVQVASTTITQAPTEAVATIHTTDAHVGVSREETPATSEENAPVAAATPTVSEAQNSPVTSTQSPQDSAMEQSPAGSTAATPSQQHCGTISFFDWLITVEKLSAGSSKTYLSSLAAIADYAKKRKLIGCSLLAATNPQDMLDLIDQIEKSTDFRRWNQYNNHRYSSLLRKYRAYAMYLTEQHMGSATSEAAQAPIHHERTPATDSASTASKGTVQDRFLVWMCNVAKLSESSAKVYRSSMLAISQYAIKEKLTTKIMLDMTDPAEICRISDQLEKSVRFQNWDQAHGKRFRPALRKFREFAAHLIATKPVAPVTAQPTKTADSVPASRPAVSAPNAGNVEPRLEAFSSWLAKAEKMGAYLRGKHVRALRAVHAYCQKQTASGKGLLDLPSTEAMPLVDTLLHSDAFASWVKHEIPDTVEILQRYCEFLAEQPKGSGDTPSAASQAVATPTESPIKPATDEKIPIVQTIQTPPQPAPALAPQPIAEKPIPNQYEIIQCIIDADLNGIRFDRLYDQFDLTKAQLQKVIDGDPKVIDFGGLLIHEDALMDWEEAQVVIDAALTKLLSKANIVTRKLLYDTVCFDLSMFFNDNDLDSEEKLYHLARHMFEKNRYQGKRYWFYGNQNICTQEQTDGVSNLNILVDFAHSKQGLVTWEEASEHFRHIGKNAGSLQMQLITDTKPHFLLYQEKTYLSVEAMQIDKTWYQEASRALLALMEETKGFVILRDVQDGFFDRMPRLPYGLKWTHLLLQQALRFWGKKMCVRTIPAHTGQQMSTLHAFLVADDADIHTFADGVAVWIALEGVEQRRYASEELRELLRDRGIIAGGELSGILHKALADDSRFAWDHEKETVVVRG